MSFLSGINSPEDIKNLSVNELKILASEIREFLIENVSRTGGHLASNLGIVEMTLAIHKVFDTKTDRLIFDVGHQSYVHKILTGRKDGFENLRKFGGVSGFCKPSESIHDACISGHASNSVSVALGMARARTLKNESFSVVSVIGDGALSGGLAYEGLNDAGHSKEPMIVILNDNEMSITKNVGAMTNYLSKIRLKKKYLRFKGIYRKIIKKTKLGIAIGNGIQGVKNAFKNMFLPSSFFEDMGFTYLGPADGHDIKYMIYLFELARDLNRPVLIHLTTTKGKGYKLSEARPEDYHGVGKFDVQKGIEDSSKKETFSSVFGTELTKLAEENEKICAITAAMTSGVGLSGFAEKYPERFFDVAIAEEHAVAMAAGLSSQGLIPVSSVYSTFLQRAYDMLIHDIAISGQHAVFAIDRAGLVGEDGETHHGVFDIAFMSSIPNFRILAPSSFDELREMMRYSISGNGPFAIRYPRGAEGAYKENSFKDGALSAVINEGTDITLITYGTLINNAVEAVGKVKENGISCEAIKLNSLKPLDVDAIIKSAVKTGKIVVVEDVVEDGSVSQMISKCLCENNTNCKVISLNSGGSFTTHGSIDKLHNVLGIDSDGIANAIMEALKK